jgi:hypothetical protein
MIIRDGTGILAVIEYRKKIKVYKAGLDFHAF